MATEAPVQQSREAIEKLKKDWQADGCWDLEETPGFEAHHEELLAFSQAHRAKAEALAHQHMAKRAEELGCPGNFKLVGYIEHLERQLEQIGSRLEVLERKV